MRKIRVQLVYAQIIVLCEVYISILRSSRTPHSKYGKCFLDFCIHFFNIIFCLKETLNLPISQPKS